MRDRPTFVIIDTSGAYLESIVQHEYSRTIRWTTNQALARHYGTRAVAQRIAEQLHAVVVELPSTGKRSANGIAKS